MEERVPQEAQQRDDAPVERPEAQAEPAGREADRDQDHARDRASEGGEGERRKERLRRLDGGITPAPEEDDQEQDRDDGGVAVAARRGSVAAGQRVFMSSGKLEENE